MDLNEGRPLSVLMVCLGNICRSPLAEVALRTAAGRSGVDLHVDSAGTGDWHVGLAPDRRAQLVAKLRGGIDIGNLRARQVSQADFFAFDYIFAMDTSNLQDLRTLMPHDGTATLSLLLDHLPGSEGQSVADPYYGDQAEFETTWRQVNAAAIAWLHQLQSQSVPPVSAKPKSSKR